MQNADFGQILCRRASTKRHVTSRPMVRFTQTWYQKMRKTWKKKTCEKACREAVGDFVGIGLILWDHRSTWDPFGVFFGGEGTHIFAHFAQIMNPCTNLLPVHLKLYFLLILFQYLGRGRWLSYKLHWTKKHTNTNTHTHTYSLAQIFAQIIPNFARICLNFAWISPKFAQIIHWQFFFFFFGGGGAGQFPLPPPPPPPPPSQMPRCMGPWCDTTLFPYNMFSLV